MFRVLLQTVSRTQSLVRFAKRNVPRIRAEDIRDVVTPWWKFEYPDQLKKKEDLVLATLPADLEIEITPSPVINGYRNKCEFSIGMGRDGQREVGFQYGSYLSRDHTIGSPELCGNVSDASKRIAAITRDFVRNSPLPVYDMVTKEGYWRQVLVRETRSGEQMVIMRTKTEPLTQEQQRTMKKELQKAYGENVSFFWQVHCGVSNFVDPALPYEHLQGHHTLTETLDEFKFDISPGSFFQVNTLAAERLYRKIREWACAGAQTTLLDMYCGTGTIGIYMAKTAQKVIGVDVIEDSVRNARANALRNNIYNCEYFTGTVEKFLPSLITHVQGDVVAVVDPPRSGLHPKVPQAILSCSPIRRLIYVSCNPDSMLNDLKKLCDPRDMHSFRVQKAAMIDMFPHTHHCETVLLLER